MDSPFTHNAEESEVDERDNPNFVDTRVFSNPFGPNNIDILTCYFLVDNRWNETQITSTKKRLTIGKDPALSQITINEPDAAAIHVVVQRFGNDWYIMELGDNNIMSVNGFLSRQVILGPESKTTLLIGKIPVVFSTKASNTKSSNQSRSLESGEFSLMLGAKEFPFYFYKPCLLGAHPICDLCFNNKIDVHDQLRKKPFVAIINNFQDCLFVRKLLHDISVTVDGVEADAPSPILRESKMNLCQADIGLSFSSDLEIPEEVFSPPEKKNKLKLLQIDKSNNIISTIKLNAIGETLIIGRSSLADICVNSQVMSRKHASLTLSEKSLFVKDQESNNGTFVNGGKIKEAKICPGDFVDFGSSKFFLCYQ